MTLQDYQKKSLRTLNLLGSDQLDILHMVLGMNGEFDELINAVDFVNRSEELTDILFYLVNYCNITGFDLDVITSSFMFGSYYNYFAHRPNVEDNFRIIKLQSEISKLTDLEKKELAYKKNVTEKKRTEAIISVFNALSDCYTYYNISPYDAMQKNIDKLKARYPEKFTEELALNRNLELERKVLEK